ncbi:MAG TPA: serine/threonine-protein kinase [bacterium]|nr:serine/threonine-protein kinase [bacterium]
MSVSALRLLEGRTIDGKYHLSEFIGEGGSSGVFKADEVVHDTLLRTVALKIIISGNGTDISKQLREIKSSIDFEHPNVLKGITAGETEIEGLGHVLYLVTELADGSLQDRLTKGVLSGDDARKVIENIVGALEYLHKNKNVHRDVKPENILLVDGVWKLADFGILRPLDKTTIRHSGVQGTAFYMPPESFNGEVTTAWDMWSLGVLLTEMLTGKFPYDADGQPEYIKCIIEKEPRIQANVPEPFQGILRGCLNKNRRARWNANHVLKHLTAPVRSAAPSASRRPLNVTPQKSYAKNWSILSVIVALVILAGAIFVIRAGWIYTAKTVKTISYERRMASHAFGGKKDDVPVFLYKTTSGGYLIGGTTESFGKGKRNGLVYIVDKEGHQKKRIIIDMAEEDAAVTMSISKDGGFIVAGETVDYGAGDKNIVVLKTDSDGKLSWKRILGSSSDDFVKSVVSTSDGGYLVTSIREENGKNDGIEYLTKLNRNGDIVWQKDSPETSRFSNRIMDDTSNISDGWESGIGDELMEYDAQGVHKISFLPDSASVFDMGKTTEGSTYMVGSYDTGKGHKGNQFLVVKTGDSGNVMWNAVLGGTDDDVATIALPEADGCVVAGYTESYGNGGRDFWMAKIDDNGKVMSRWLN